MGSVIADARVQGLIDRLQAASQAQEPEMGWYFSERAKKGDLSWDGLDSEASRFMADKYVALEPIKAEFAYLQCRAVGARRVVEVGTSYGVSTLYLAQAVKENGGGVVIATEYEAEKAAKAREHFAEAGLSDLIELREGDLRETLQDLSGPIDFVLMDIWTEMARPAIDLIGPHLRTGAVVVADNTGERFAHSYRHFFAWLDDPANRMRRLKLPFDGGLEMCVRV